MPHSNNFNNIIVTRAMFTAGCQSSDVSSIVAAQQQCNGNQSCCKKACLDNGNCPCGSDYGRCPGGSGGGGTGGWSGDQAFNVCKAGKDIGTFCQPSVMDGCCVSECTQLHPGDPNCLQDCKNLSQNYCSGQGGGGGGDLGPKFGDDCCRFDTTKGGGCEYVGTCYENECKADGDTCYPNDVDCSKCKAAQGGGGPTPPDTTAWTQDERDQFINDLTARAPNGPGIQRNVAQCVEKNTEDKYSHKQFANLPHNPKTTKFFTDLTANCVADPNYDAHNKRVSGGGGGGGGGGGLSTGAIIGIVAGSLLLLGGLIALFMSRKKNRGISV